MPFEIPDLDLLRARIRQDLMARLPGTDATLRWNNERIIADVEAGAVWLLYERLEWQFRQLFPDTAESEFLDRWASIWGVARKAATKAHGVATFAATTGSGVTGGAIAFRGDGVRYVAAEGASESNLIVALDFEAEEPGAAGNSDPGTQLTLATTFNGVSPLGYVSDLGMTGGADAETDASLRARVLLRIQNPPQGGSASDYEQWALEVPGVTRAWTYPLENGPGTVVVRFMMDDVRAPSGIPTPGDVADVQAHIDPLAPITARVTVTAPEPLPLDILIGGLNPDTPEIRASIEEQLQDLMRHQTQPGGQITREQIIVAISHGVGVVNFVLLVPIGISGSEIGQIFILGNVDYAG